MPRPPAHHPGRSHNSPLRTGSHALTAALVALVAAPLSCTEEYEYPDAVPVNSSMHYVDAPLRRSVLEGLDTTLVALEEGLQAVDEGHCAESDTPSPPPEVTSGRRAAGTSPSRDESTTDTAKPPSEESTDIGGAEAARRSLSAAIRRARGRGGQPPGTQDGRSIEILADESSTPSPVQQEPGDALWSCQPSFERCRGTIASVTFDRVLGRPLSQSNAVWLDALFEVLPSELDAGFATLAAAETTSRGLLEIEERCEANGSPLVTFLDEQLPRLAREEYTESRRGERSSRVQWTRHYTVRDAHNLRDRLLSRDLRGCAGLAAMYRRLLASANRQVERLEKQSQLACYASLREVELHRRLSEP